MLSTSKIEDRAIGTLRNIIDDHQTMSHAFNTMDKEMAWDGYISIYKSDKESISKANLDDKVPVQIKGHLDNEEKYMNKTRITYPVSLSDLKVYFNDRGVLYFQIFITEDGSKRSVFYSSLFPTKIKSYLERAKKNKDSTNIVFTKIEKSAKDFYIAVKQFSNESRKQGFGCGQIVQSTIPLKDLNKVTSISASVVGAASELDIIERFTTGDVSLYGTIDGCPFKIPIEWTDNSTISMRKKIAEKVYVDDIPYYDSFEIETNSKKEYILSLGKNIKFNLTQSSFELTQSSSIKDLRKDADFIYAVQKHGYYSLLNNKIFCKDIQLSKELNKSLKLYIELDDVLSMIEFDYDKIFDEISYDTLRQLYLLVEIKNGDKNNCMPDDFCSFNWKLEGKYLPLIIHRDEDGIKNIINNTIYTSKYSAFITNENNEKFRVPLFQQIPADIMGNLYYYDYNNLCRQIEESEVNDYTFEMLSKSALNLISAYDLSNNKILLDLAKLQLEKLNGYKDSLEFYTLNFLQIKKRLNTLDETDRLHLHEIKTDDIKSLCCINVLLDNTERAKHYYEKMTEEDHMLFDGFPIENLYKKIIGS